MIFLLLLDFMFIIIVQQNIQKNYKLCINKTQYKTKSKNESIFLMFYYHSHSISQLNTNFFIFLHHKCLFIIHGENRTRKSTNQKQRKKCQWIIITVVNSFKKLYSIAFVESFMFLFILFCLVFLDDCKYVCTYFKMQRKNNL